jgi:hypothetical protein
LGIAVRTQRQFHNDIGWRALAKRNTVFGIKLSTATSSLAFDIQLELSLAVEQQLPSPSESMMENV